MKLFVITVDETEWDECDAIAVLAKNKEKAIDIAVRQHHIFLNNIDEVEEIELDHQGIVLESVKWG